MSAPRVFYVGETVPAGVRILTSAGEDRFLDDTASCTCDREPGTSCDECSYDVVWTGIDPVVELRLSDYYAEVVRAEDVRRAALASIRSLRQGGAR